MKVPQLLTALACVLAISCGQILFKLSAARLETDAGLAAAARSLVLNPWLAAAALLFIAATVGWVGVLRSAPLSIVFPLNALSFVFVPVLARILLGEAISAQTVAGSTLIIAGIIIVFSQA